MEEDEDEQTMDAIEKSSGQNLAIEAPSSHDEQCDKREDDTEIAEDMIKPQTNDISDSNPGSNSDKTNIRLLVLFSMSPESLLHPRVKQTRSLSTAELHAGFQYNFIRNFSDNCFRIVFLYCIRSSVINYPSFSSRTDDWRGRLLKHRIVP